VLNCFVHADLSHLACYLVVLEHSGGHCFHLAPQWASRDRSGRSGFSTTNSRSTPARFTTTRRTREAGRSCLAGWPHLEPYLHGRHRAEWGTGLAIVLCGMILLRCANLLQKQMQSHFKACLRAW